MRILKRMKGRLAGGLMTFGVFTGATFVLPAGALTTVDAPAAQTTTPTVSTVRYSPGAAEILKMVDARVGTDVIKAYIKNSTVAYNPTASEIIALKERGVPDDVLAAMLQRGGEVRAGQGNGVPTAPVYPYPQTPNYAYPQAPAYPYDYGIEPGYVDYGYPAYPYAYPYYSSYWWYNYGYPWGFYSPFFASFDFFGHRHFRDFDFGRRRFDRDFDFHHRFGGPNQRFASRPFGGFPRTSFAARSSAPFAPARSFGSRPGMMATRSSAFGGTRSFGGGFRGGFSGGARGGGFGGGHGGGHR
ncbi:MAG TPA: hypothetical protein VN578_09985 [Candidatus Binatia bacterium]|jgi:hypothetical protein|nr:hypothetical protein [Candidatus Binatia bacterium]